MHLRTLGTGELGLRREAELRAMLDAAWAAKEDDFTDSDWLSATGGMHLLLEDDGGAIVSHASVVDRVLETGGRALAAGYVEAVATAPAFRRRGHATTMMRAVADLLDERYELGPSIPGPPGSTSGSGGRGGAAPPRSGRYAASSGPPRKTGSSWSGRRR